jgi:PAS domain S-box-containing protein
MHAHDAAHLKSKRFSKAIYETIVEMAYEGIFIYQGGRFHYVNPAFERMLGYSFEELEEMGFRDVMHKDAWMTMEKRCQAVINGEEVRPRRLDVIFVTRAGHERTISLSPRPSGSREASPPP